MNAIAIKKWREEKKKNQFLPYDVISDSNCYLLVFNLPEHLSADFKLFVDRAQRKIKVTLGSQAENALHNYSFFFDAPIDADLHEVTLQSRNSAHVVCINKAVITKNNRRKSINNKYNLTIVT